MSKLTQEEFIKRAINVHGNKYDYSILCYKSSKEKIKYICPKHGVIEQNAHSHLLGHGCRYCSNEESHETSRDTKISFINKAIKVHGDKYDYSLVNYIDSQTKVAIICHKKDALGEEHGVFWQKPNSHLQGHKCPKCNGRNRTTEEWIAEAKTVYPEGKYSFEKTKYTHARDKVIVTCCEHGDFLTLSRDFLRGHGCPKCQLSKLEYSVEKWLQKYNINYESQKTFEWLYPLKADFYIPISNIIVECQGEQHYKDKDFFNKREGLKERQERDSRKRQLCAENGVELIYFTEPKFAKYETSGNRVFTDVNELIEYIKNKKIE